MTQGRPDLPKRPLRIALIVGEASGDVLGASLIQALAARHPDAEFFGIGGPKMIAAGLVSAYDQEKLAVRGAVEVLKHLPEILRIRRGILAQLTAWKPDVMVGIDAPDFNLPIEKRLKARGIPTVHYVSPTVWAWRRGRAKRIVAAVNQLLCLFPFEPACYKGQGLEPVFIGHPLADEISPDIDREQQRSALNLPEASPLITLMPGSRQSELDFHAQLFVETANRIAAELPDALFVVPLATPATRDRFEAALQAFGAKQLRVRILFGDGDPGGGVVALSDDHYLPYFGAVGLDLSKNALSALGRFAEYSAGPIVGARAIAGGRHPG